MYENMTINEIYSRVIILESDLTNTSNPNDKIQLEKDLEEARNALIKRVCIE